MSMSYRRLGRAGVRVSTLSLGSWVTYANQVDARAAVEMLAAAFDAGVNFFDNAEVYAAGQSEVVMGEALKTLGWPRLNYLVSTKFFWGLDRQGEAVNRKDTLNRKYLMQAIDGSLQRFGLELHRPDLLPPPRPAHADRRDGARDERHHHPGQGAVLGHQRMVAPATSAPPGRSPSATTCTSR